jgi:hypothetical protein
MDQFSAHGTDRVLSTARGLMVEIIWVPKGATRLYQPLDRRVFDALKSKGSAKWRCLYAQNYRHPYNRETARWLLLGSWDELSHPVMTASWDFNEEGPDNDSDDSDNHFELRLDMDGEDLNDEINTEEEEEVNEEGDEEP